MKKFIAERRLLYSSKGDDDRKELVVRIGIPYIVEEGTVNFPIDVIVAGCHLEFEGLSDESQEIYGVDTLQAINIASDIESDLKRLEKKYDLYWANGEPYFGE